MDTEEGLIFMGADNWTTCPRCLHAKTAEVDKLKIEAAAACGKASPEEYNRLMTEAHKPWAVDDTLREDYEIGIHEGRFYVIYGASCSECDFEYSFRANDEDICKTT